MARIADDPRFHRTTALVHDWLVKFCIGDRALDDVEEEFLTIAAEAGAFVWLLDVQQQLTGPLSPELAVAYPAALADYEIAARALGIYREPRMN